MVASSRRWRHGIALASAAALFSVPGAAFAAGGPPGGGGGGGGGGDEGGGETTVANNLSVPAVFVPDTTGAPALNFPCGDAVAPTTPPDVQTGFEVNPTDYYFVQGVHKWQASCATAAAGTVTAEADWGDNLTGDAALKAGSPIRVEVSLLEAAPPEMTGFTVDKLQPSLLDRNSGYGILATEDVASPGTYTANAVSPYGEVRVWDAAAKLKIYNLTTPNVPITDGAATAEINSTGRIVYGYNLRVSSAGKYVLEFTSPDVTVSNAPDGHTVSLTVTVTSGRGGGGGGGGGGGDSDTTPPASQATTVPVYSSSTVPVSFTAADSSMLTQVDLYVKGPQDTSYSLVQSKPMGGQPTGSGTFDYVATEGDGVYEFYTVATDASGNVEVAPAEADVVTTVDTTAPTSSASSPQFARASYFDVGYTTADSGSGVASVTLFMRRPGTTGYLPVATLDNPPASGVMVAHADAGDGEYLFYTVATDKVGNVERAPTDPAYDSMTRLDTVAPTSAATSPAGVATTTFDVGYTTNDGGSGVAQLVLFMRDPGGSAYAPIATVVAPPSSGTIPVTVSAGNGDYAFATQATDKAGNVETLSTLPAYDSVTKVTVPATLPSGGTVPPSTNPPSTNSPADTTAPTVTSVIVTKTLTGPSTVTFSEPVHGLTAGGAAIVLTGTSTIVPSTVTCMSGSTAVQCSGTFTKLQLRPHAALMPGQHCTIRLLAGAVKDAAGNPLVAKSVAFRASLVEQERSPAAHQSWATLKTTGAYGGSLVRERLRSATATWRFTGSRVTWWTVTGPDQGKADVWIDGHLVRTVNNYAKATHYKVARTFSGFAAKAHVIRIVALGQAGASAGTNTFVSIDAFTVGKTRWDTPALTTSWQLVAAKALSDGRAMAAGLRGEAFTFAFRGTGITWFTEKARWMGKAAVYLDGVYKGTVDNYAATTRYGVSRSVTKLSDKPHTLRIVVLGTHRTGATGTTVIVDKLKVS